MFPIINKQVKAMVFAASAAGLFAGSAQAVTTLDADAFGNYGRIGGIHTGSHNPDTFLVGRNMSEYHNGYIVFDLSASMPDTVQASLDIFIAGFESIDGVETISLFDVSTGLADLTGGTGTPNAGGTFDDLGTGAIFGSIDVTAGDIGSTLTINFNAAGVAAINGAAGGELAIGAAVTSLLSEQDPSFDFWDSEKVLARLPSDTLTTDPMPEPSSTMLLGLGGLSMLLRRKRG